MRIRDEDILRQQAMNHGKGVRVGRQLQVVQRREEKPGMVANVVAGLILGVIGLGALGFIYLLFSVMVQK